MTIGTRHRVVRNERMIGARVVPNILARGKSVKVLVW